MSIQGMRNWIKGHRKWIIGLFVLLVFGLVGTYATSGMKGAGVVPGEITPQQRMEAYNKQIETARAALKTTPEGFGENSTLAGLLFESASVLLELEKKDQADANFKEAAVIYEKALEVAPKELNAAGRIRLLVSAAGCYFMVEDNTSAEKYYTQAIELDAKDYSANVSYVQFLVLTGRMEEAKQKLTVYKALMSPEDPNMESVNALLQSVKDMIENGEDPTAPQAEDDKAEDTK